MNIYECAQAKYQELTKQPYYTNLELCPKCGELPFIKKDNKFFTKKNKLKNFYNSFNFELYLIMTCKCGYMKKGMDFFKNDFNKIMGDLGGLPFTYFKWVKAFLEARARYFENSKDGKA